MIHARQNFKLTSSSHRKKIANLVSITITFRCTCYFDWKTFSFPKDDHWNFFNSIQASIWWVKNRMQLPQQVPDIRKTRVEGHGEKKSCYFLSSLYAPVAEQNSCHVIPSLLKNYTNTVLFFQRKSLSNRSFSNVVILHKESLCKVSSGDKTHGEETYDCQWAWCKHPVYSLFLNHEPL